MKNKKLILNSNCSETVFRLTGEFKDIQKQVLNLITWVRMEYDGTVNGKKRKLNPDIVKKIKDLRLLAKKAKTLKELENIMIPFTCNYETFFREIDGDLFVATCNNYNYDNVEKEQLTDAEADYYTVAGATDYTLLEKYEDNWVLKLSYDDDKHLQYPKFLVIDKSFDLRSYDEKKLIIGHQVRLIIRDDCVYMQNMANLQRIYEIKDQKKLNKIKLVLSIEKHED